MDDDYIALRARERGDDGEPGDALAVGLTPAQALDLRAGRAVSYFEEEPEPFVDEDGTLGERHVTGAEKGPSTAVGHLTVGPDHVRRRG